MSVRQIISKIKSVLWWPISPIFAQPHLMFLLDLFSYCRQSSSVEVALVSFMILVNLGLDFEKLCET